MRLEIIWRRSHGDAAAFVRSTKVQIFRCDHHIADRHDGIVLGFGSHLNNSGIEALIFAPALAVIIVTILVAYVGMVYGPIGAFLAEYFPARIRYTSVSVPYHIGNGWGGGLVPSITTAAYRATGSLGYALLPDRCSRGMLRAQPVPDAGDRQDEKLGAGRGKGVIGRENGNIHGDLRFIWRNPD
jgi:hypothetical protein